jgi:hypothetical protein
MKKQERFILPCFLRKLPTGGNLLSFDGPFLFKDPAIRRLLAVSNSLFRLGYIAETRVKKGFTLSYRIPREGHIYCFR